MHTKLNVFGIKRVSFQYITRSSVLLLLSKLFILYNFLIIFTSFVSDQPITYAETISYLNKKFDGKVVFKDKKQDLILTFFKKGAQYRTDKIYMLGIDPDAVSYSEEEKRIILRCKKEESGCIHRKIEQPKITDNYSRIALSTEGFSEKEIQGIQAALTHLLKLTYYSDHQRTTPFEQ